ncbi:hypothetical protein KJS94_14360 [Flavihumibacter rivuli]|uniref:hypothetical protein n=1 Tax=Flavihumibacter rivuli TaxID=2838156 RepID=UPI001BDF1347|nr:hypothetical protein [Flavihumibacter rivuli]ULQ55829.1 hypothetical protein KJS94_14360 [Flavihumibacter rivuli]
MQLRTVGFSTEKEAFVYFLGLMATKAIDLLLRDELTNQRMPKRVFMEKLERAFSIFRD